MHRGLSGALVRALVNAKRVQTPKAARRPVDEGGESRREL